MTWEDLAKRELRVYTTAWCPDCHRLKRILRDHRVPFTEVDIEAEPEAAKRLEQATGRTAIPYVQIGGGPMVPGWHEGVPGRFSAERFLAESEEALAAVGNG